MASRPTFAVVRRVLALLIAATLYACTGDGGALPEILMITPSTVKPGDQITIEGLNFGNPAVAVDSEEIREGFGVSIGGVQLRFSLNLDQSDIISWDGDSGIIVAKVPGDVKGPQAKVIVSTDVGKSKPAILLIGEPGTGVVQPIIGWVLHDNAPKATLFMATAAGLITDPSSWTLSTEDFPADLSANEYAAQWDFNWGADWDVQLNDVSASLENAVAYLSISATDVSSGVSYNFLRPFEGYMLENAKGDLPTGLGPVRLGDWGPVVALGIGDQTVSHIDATAGTVAAIDYVELIDANFIALGIYGGVDDATGLPYTTLVGNTKLKGTAKMLVLWQEPGKNGAAPSPQVLPIENESWVLNGMVTSDGWNSYVIARHIDGCTNGYVFADCSGPDYVVKVRYRGNATEGTNFDPSLVEFMGVVRFPDGVELRGIAKTQHGLYLPYASRSSDATDGDGVYMLRSIDGLDDVFADKLTQTVEVVFAGDVSAEADSSETRILSLEDSYNPGTFLAEAEITVPTRIAPNTYATIQIKVNDTGYPNWDTYIPSLYMEMSGSGTLGSYLIGETYGEAPPYYGHPNPNFATETSASATLYTTPSQTYYELYFFPLANQEYTATITVTVNGAFPAMPTTTTFNIEVSTFRTVDAPAAVDIKTTEGGMPVSDPRDVYVIPNTPLVLVSSHDDDSVAVINSLLSPVYMHKFPSYGSGPTRLACGITGDASEQ